MRYYRVTRGGALYPEDNRIARETGKPFVAIDPEDREQVERLARRLGHGDWDGTVTGLREHLREFANLKPPKPKEPTGLGAVVEDAEGYQWVRLPDPRGKRWYRDNAWEAEGDWAEIDAVKVLSPGVPVE